MNEKALIMGSQLIRDQKQVPLCFSVGIYVQMETDNRARLYP